MGGFGNRPTDEQSYIVGLAGEDEAQSAGVEKTKIFIINTKGDIKYTTSEGEEKHTDFAELERMCDAFFPPLAHLERKVGMEDESKAALCVCCVSIVKCL